MPANNQRDFDELPNYIREGITAHFAEKYDHVYRVLFPEKQVKIKPRKK